MSKDLIGGITAAIVLVAAFLRAKFQRALSRGQKIWGMGILAERCWGQKNATGVEGEKWGQKDGAELL